MNHDAGGPTDRQACELADRRDPLAWCRDRFHLPDGVVYLDGNSLGALQPSVAERITRTTHEEWGSGLIRSWNDAGWVDLPRRVAARIAPIVGVDADEIAVTDSTSANLFKVLTVAHQLRPQRQVLLTDDANFPTDIYVAEGLADLGDVEVHVVPTSDILSHLDVEVAALFLTHVDYRTGHRNDGAALTAAAHDVGALAVWDLSHTAGALAVDLHAWGADLAVGCTYKYLNGGPGAPAYLYVARRWHDRISSPLRGWFGHAEPFAFDRAYRPAAGASRFLDGTPPVLSMAALDAALEIWEEVDPVEVERKSSALTQLFLDLVATRCSGAVEVLTPTDPARRGSQVSLRHPDAFAVMQALVARGVIGDHRPADVLRFGFAPLYVSHTAVWDAVEVLAEVLADRAWDPPEDPPRRAVP